MTQERGGVYGACTEPCYPTDTWTSRTAISMPSMSQCPNLVPHGLIRKRKIILFPVDLLPIGTSFVDHLHCFEPNAKYAVLRYGMHQNGEMILVSMCKGVEDAPTFNVDINRQCWTLQ
jgi:hypothetical protein